MSLVFADGFEAYAAAQLGSFWSFVNVSSPGAQDTVTGRYGGVAARYLATSGGGQGPDYMTRSIPSSTNDFVMMAAVQVVTNSTANKQVLTLMESGSVRHLGIWVGVAAGSTFPLYVTRGTTIIATSPTPLTDSVWHWIEMKGRIHDTTGYYVVRIDGTEVLNVTGVDTRNGGTAGAWDSILLGNADGGITNYDFRIDDFGLIKIDGTGANDFLGECREIGLIPTGAGNSTQFTPSAGSNYQNVDEGTASADDDTTYNVSSTTNHKDTFATTDLPTTGTIYQVREVLRARKVDAGFRTIRQILRVNGTDYEGSDRTLAPGYQSWESTRLVSPDTGVAFTKTEIDAMQLGYKIQS